LARHFHDVERLSIAEIAGRLGRSPATVKAYLYDPTGAKARAVKARYQGVCHGCGNATQPRNGKGDAYEYCKRCVPAPLGPDRIHLSRRSLCGSDQPRQPAHTYSFSL